MVKVHTRDAVRVHPAGIEEDDEEEVVSSIDRDIGQKEERDDRRKVDD